MVRPAPAGVIFFALFSRGSLCYIPPMSLPSSLVAVFAEALAVSEARITPELRYNGIPQWDSVAHMQLVMKLEKTFGVMMDPEDILDLSTPAKAAQILAKLGAKI